jgi:hypothetical protein
MRNTTGRKDRFEIDLKQTDWKDVDGFSWLRILTSGRLL